MTIKPIMLDFINWKRSIETLELPNTEVRFYLAGYVQAITDLIEIVEENNLKLPDEISIALKDKLEQVNLIEIQRTSFINPANKPY